MKENKYFLIDKSIIAEGCSYDFEIYCAVQGSSKVKHLKSKGKIIHSDEIVLFQEAHALYVPEEDNLSYKKFYESHIVKELNQRKNLASQKGKPVSFTEKVEVMYQNASKTLNELFNNPETLSNYKESKKVVNQLIDSVLDDDFALKSLMCIATHDYYTHTHSINVAIYALSLGTFMGMDPEELSELGEAALLHDLGKSQIDSAIINKKGILTREEFQIMKKHPIHGARLGLQLGIRNKQVLNGIKYHHEKSDGSGYPAGLYKDEIPLYARIISICDIFDALTSERSYKKALTSFEALTLMKNEMSNNIDISLLRNMVLMFR